MQHTFLQGQGIQQQYYHDQFFQMRQQVFPSNPLHGMRIHSPFQMNPMSMGFQHMKHHDPCNPFNPLNKMKPQFYGMLNPNFNESK